MVRGLDVFRSHFADHSAQFVLIGGTAATIAMESAGLAFRATKDLDINGRREIDKLPWIGAEQLIPLKGRAWLDLTARKAHGEAIDTRDIRKHASDAIRLSQLLAPDSRIGLDAQIANDMRQFLSGVLADGTYDPRSIGIQGTAAEILSRIAAAYGLTLHASART